MGKCLWLVIELSKRKIWAQQLNSSILSIYPREIHVPIHKKTCTGISVAQFAKAIISYPSEMGKWTMACLFHGVVNGNMDKQTRVAWIHVNTPLEYNVKPKSKLQKDICRTLPFIWNWTISKTQRGMINPKLTLVVVGIQGRDCKGASGGVPTISIRVFVLFCFVFKSWSKHAKNVKVCQNSVVYMSVCYSSILYILLLTTLHLKTTLITFC